MITNTLDMIIVNVGETDRDIGLGTSQWLEHMTSDAGAPGSIHGQATYFSPLL
jgi:hypothetical protein